MSQKNPLIERLAPWVAVGALVIIWEATVRLFEVPSFIFPSALETAQALVTYAGPIAMHSWQTFWTTLIGFGLGVAVGLVLGFIIGSSRFLYNACYPLLVISAMAMVMYELFAQLEKRMTGWAHRGQNR